MKNYERSKLELTRSTKSTFMAASSIVTVGATATKEAGDHKTTFPGPFVSGTKAARRGGRRASNLAQKGLAIAHACHIRLVMVGAEVGSVAGWEVRERKKGS